MLLFHLIFAPCILLLVSARFRKHCSSIPAFTLMNSTGDFSTNHEGDTKFVYTTEPATVTFYCVANQPIKIELESPLPSLVEDVLFSREVRNLSDSSSYCYGVIFKSGSTYRSTGKYTCSVIENRQLSASILLFSESERGSILLNSGAHTLIKGIPDDDGWITLPCVSTNPFVVPNITIGDLKGNVVENLKLVIGSFEYVSGLGFRIRAKYVECCTKQYICKLSPNSAPGVNIETSTNVILYKTEVLTGKVFYRVSPSDYVLGFNSETETKLRLHLNGTTTLSCESNFAVKMEVKDISLPAEHVNFKAEFVMNTNSFYNHKAILQLMTLKVGLLTVVCRAVHNKLELHKWTITTVTKEEYDPSSGVHILKEKRYPITCYSAGAKAPSISIIQCKDFINCAIAEKFSASILKANLEEPDKFPFDVISGHTGCVRDRHVSNGLGCAEVSPHFWSKRGIVKCREAQSDDSYLVYTQNFMIGFHDSIVKLPQEPMEEAGKEADDKSVLEMGPIKTELYVDEEVNVSCRAAYGIFSMGIQIVFQLENGTNLTTMDFGRLNFGEKLDNQIITYEGTIKIEAAKINRIWCFAPIWNSPNWRSISRDVTVKVGVAPDIIDSSANETLEYRIGESGHSLRCEVVGEPEPKVRWKKDQDGLSDINSKVKSIKFDGKTTVLELEDIVEAHGGLYTCEAWNVKGTETRHYQIKVIGAGSDLFLYLGVAGAILVFALIIICVLIKLLRNRRNTIHKLSELEIHEFQFGNQNLATKFAELNENARYLPYKQDFEIPHTKLEINEEEVLGAGAFGLVLKGYFTRHSERIPVAIKTVRSNADISHLRNLLSEIKILMYIGQHANVVALLGAITRELRDGKLHVVVEYCEHGNLLSFLRESRQAFINQIANDGRLDFRKTSAPNTKLRPGSNLSIKSWKIDDFLPDTRKTLERRNSKTVSPIKTMDLITWAMQIADGMIYLGSKNVIHGDLATRNILLTNSYIVKITDFGLSTHLYDYTNYIRKQKDEPVPWRWLSIEAIRDSKFSIATDIWAYGVTLWEMFSLAEVPYQGFSWGTEFVDKLYAGLRLTSPPYATAEIFRQMEKCWELEPGDRTPFLDSRDFFSSILNSSSSK